MRREKLITLIGSICLILVLAVLSLIGACAPTPTPPAPTPPVPTPEPAPPEAEVIHWTGQSDFSLTEVPFGHFELGRMGAWGEGWVWYDWITKATDGRLAIDFKTSGAINPPGETFDMVSKGAYEIGCSTAPFYSGKFPEADVEVGLPFAWTNINQRYECLFDYGLYQELKQAYAEQNIYWIPLCSDSLFSLGGTFPLDTLNSIKGKKIRSTGVFGDVIAALGATPASMPYPELYQALQLGTVDGYVSGFGLTFSNGWYEVAKHFVVEPRFTLWLNNILINMDAYNALPEDIQKLLDVNAPYVGATVGYYFAQQCEWAVLQSEKEFGMNLYTWSPQDIERARETIVEQVWPKVAEKSPRNARMIEIIKQQLRDYGKLD